MGNCLFGGIGELNEVIKVVTSNGGIMEFNGPIMVECITDEFPGHGIFRSRDLFWKPLAQYEVLMAGESYYLLPLNNNNSSNGSKGGGEVVVVGGQIAQVGHVRSNSVPATATASSLAAPYRMSFDYGQAMLKRSYTEMFSAGYNTTSTTTTGSGFWKVKLVISPAQLLEILSQEARTQELVESVRTVAKCGHNGVSSMGFSDQWSLSSSRNAASSKPKKVGLLEI